MDLPPPLAFFLSLPTFDNPFAAMGYLIVHGGWFLILLTLLLGLWELWIFEIHEQYEHDKFKFMLLAVNVPKRSEQTAKATENFFSSLMGLHVSINMWENYVEGRKQEWFACEIASHGGFIQFYIYIPVRQRDIFEAAIFAQYPDAEVHEAQDYTLKYPNKYPSDEWDAWGTELVLKKSQCWPIKTYPLFEDKLSGTFKDPLSQLFEFMGTIQPGEELWVQYPILPIEQDWQDPCRKEIDKMIGLRGGKKDEPNPLLALLHALGDAVMYIVHSAVAGKAPEGRETAHKDDDPLAVRSNILAYGPGELLNGIANKASKLGYKSKIRILYIARKEIASKNRKRAVQGIMGVFRQFNAHDMNTFGLGRRTFVRAYYYFVQYRLNRRKNILMRAYRRRSVKRGDKPAVLSVEELATLWHFPSLDISAPLLRKAEVKRGEPPSGLPMADYDYAPPAPAPKPKDDIPENLPFA
ncbi:hypothetical protein HY623_03985 [Candidatus Uhrbacteria bacterium]|nr:hypothetical protein [Candidatus Uhrbacteria bacterium]